MATDQNPDSSQVNQSGNFGIGVMTGGTIESGAVVAGTYVKPPEPKPIPSNVRRGSKNYVEREENTLKQIHQKLQVGQGVIVCAVEGMGGVGKTELSLQYAQKNKQEYAAQYFLSLRETKLPQAIATLASPYIPLLEPMQAATVEEQAEWYWQNWLPNEGKMLVILDDVPNAESIPEQAMPFDPRVQVLVTTRERDLHLGFESLSLAVLSEEKSIALLEKIVGKPKVAKELATVQAICQTLGYLPLGLELVGEYLVKNRHLNFAKLQERLSLADKVLSQERRHKLYGQRGVAAAIQLSWDDLSAAAQRVAMWLGLFAPVEILWALVEVLAEDAEITAAELEEARGELDRLHLIQPTDDSYDFYKIHALVREFFREKLAAATENQQFRQGFVTGLLGLAKQMPQTPTLDLIATMTPVIPHLDLLSREMLGDIENPEADLYWAFGGIGRFYFGQGLYTLAENSHLRCVESTKKILGENNRSFATSLNNLAALYESQGKYEAAEPLYQQALSLMQELLGDRSPFIASSLDNLALLYQSQGKYEAAEPLYQQALSLRQELLGDRHPDVATSLNNLAALYDSQGKYEAAEPLYQQALSLRQELLGDRHPDVAASLNNLAVLRYYQNRYDEAESLFLQALEIWESVLGSNHPNTQSTKRSLENLRANRPS